jgi:hypothetical protein
VSTRYGVVPITDSTENYIGFKGEGNHGEAIQGRIDRISGATGLSIQPIHGNENFIDYFKVVCKPAKPLF